MRRRSLVFLLSIVGALGALLGISRSSFATDVHVLPSVLEPAGTGGVAAVDRALAKLSTSARVLVIGAHPDDEDTALLAYVSKKLGGEAAYLSLSRGEGGQNLVGPELGVDLGILRTNELLAARGVDGARQFFTRAFDFGYTRSREETLRFWPKDDLVRDAVRIMRRYRPQVVVSIFGNDGSGGHGQHQAAGLAAHEAFRLAGDAAAYPELAKDEGLAPWKPLSLFRAAWFQPEAATAKFSLSSVEPISGSSIFQLAARSRSQHLSQDMGRIQELGPRDDQVIFEEGAAAVSGGKDLFGGFDTHLASIAAGIASDAARREATDLLARTEESARAARSTLAPGRLGEIASVLAKIVGDLDRAAASARTCADPACGAAAQLIEEKRRVAIEGLVAAAGVALDAASDREALVPGESAKIILAVWNSGGSPIELRSIVLESPTLGALPAVAGLETPKALAPGEISKLEVALPVAASAAATMPYFLGRPLQGSLYDWSAAAPEVRGEPFGPPPLKASFELAIGGATVRLAREVVYRTADPSKGEIRRPLRIVPRVEVAVAPALAVIGNGAPREAAFEVTLASNTAAPVSGTVDLESRCAKSAALPFSIAEPHGKARLRLSAAPCGDDAAEVRAVAHVADGTVADLALPLVDYPHIRATPVPHPAEAKLERLDLAWPRGARVGYVRGAADRVPEALEAAGLHVELLEEKDFATDLARFTAIVVGPRAYEFDAWLARANARLLDYAKAGGLVVVQYQQYPYVDGKFAPYPLEIARPHDRITDETSPVTLLDPASPVFNRPNKIAPPDWNGWVQERALYMPHSWDAGWKPLLAMKDPDQPEQRGALLVASSGKGSFVYTGIAFFRQLPAGVPGAFRLFANLLALGPAPKP